MLCTGSLKSIGSRRTAGADGGGGAQAPSSAPPAATPPAFIKESTISRRERGRLSQLVFTGVSPLEFFRTSL